VPGRALLVAVGTALVVALSACQTSGSSDDDVDPVPTAVAFGPTATGSLDDGSGHSVSVGVAVGPPQAASGVTEAQACTAAFGTGAEVTVPVQITATLRGPSALPVTVSTGGAKGLTADGHASLANVSVRWSAKYSEVPQKCMDQGVTGASVHWDAMQPGSTQTFIAWMVLSAGVTNDDPTGANTAGDLVLDPTVSLGGRTGTPRFDTSAHAVVQCLNYGPESRSPYIALVPGLAVHRGCRSASVGDAVVAAHDAVCRAAYPDTSSTTTGGVTRYTRTASLFQVCEGFGGDHVTLTSAMACAIVALTADQLGKSASRQVHQVDQLCKANDVVQALSTGKWVDEAEKAGCEFIGGVFARGLAIAAAGATVETGAGVLIGVAAYHALSAGVSVACDGGLRDAARNYGAQVEANHEAHVARDITNDSNLCLQDDSGAVLKRWSAVPCG
jgi:enoyl-CoA hydratase/carnithine racemase